MFLYMTVSGMGNIIIHTVTQRFLLSIATALLVVGTCQFPVRTLLGIWYSKCAADILKQNNIDFSDVEGDSRTSLRAAEEALEKAAALSPENALYLSALSAYHQMNGRWLETMGVMGQGVQDEFPEGSYKTALRFMKKSIASDPLNPDYYLALAQYHSHLGDDSIADKYLQTALWVYPINSRLNYAVSNEYLLTGRKEKALQVAKNILLHDETYSPTVPEEIRKRMVRRSSPQNEAILNNSFFYKALEIIWRASDKNPALIQSSVADNPEAQEAGRFSLESKGVF
jgi:tetratricopeptide (TPR) repeat protein